MLLDNICALEGCTEEIPASKPIGTAYHHINCRQKAYRVRERIAREMYRRIDKDTIMVPWPEKQWLTEDCPRCNGLSMLDAGLQGGRSIRICPDCLYVMRRRP